MTSTNILKQTLIPCLLLATAFGTLSATRVRLVNLKEMTAIADRIFWGVCLQARELKDPALGLTVTEYTFQVRRPLKGVGADQTVVFRQLQSTSNRAGALNIPGIPRYSPGQDRLIFLAGDSRMGLTSPVGLDQGLFRVEEDKESGRLMVMNSLHNSNLNHNLPVASMRSAGLNRKQVKFLSDRKAIPLDDFAELVRAFEQRRAGKAGR